MPSVRLRSTLHGVGSLPGVLAHASPELPDLALQPRITRRAESTLHER